MLASASPVSTTLDFRSLMRIQNSTDPVTADICWKLPPLVVVFLICNNSFEIPLLLFAPQELTFTEILFYMGNAMRVNHSPIYLVCLDAKEEEAFLTRLLPILDNS